LAGLDINELDDATLARVAAMLDAYDAAQSGTEPRVAALPAEPVAAVAASIDMANQPIAAVALDDSADLSDEELAAILDGATAAIDQPMAAVGPAASVTADVDFDAL